MGQGPSFHYVLHKGVPIRASSCYSSTNKVAVNKGKYSDLNASYSLERITVNEMWFVREKCASSEERQALCCWGRLEGRSETNPCDSSVPAPAPVGRQKLCFQPLVEEAPGNLPQAVYPLSQGGSEQLGIAGSRHPPCPSPTASLPGAPGAVARARVWAMWALLRWGHHSQDRTPGDTVSGQNRGKRPIQARHHCGPWSRQSGTHSDLFVKDPSQAPTEVYSLLH